MGHISTLPTEIMLDVFDDVLAEPNNKSSPFVPNVPWKGSEPTPFYARRRFQDMRLACRAWNNIFQTTSSFWNIISVDQKENLHSLRLALERSGDLNLFVTLRYTRGLGESWLSEVATMLEPHLRRCQTMEVLLPPARMFYILDHWINTSVPRLRSLRLSVVGDEEGLLHSRPMKLITKLPPLFGNHMPALSEAWLFYISLDWKGSQVPFSMLRSLNIIHDDTDPPLYEKASGRLLLECHSLEELRWMGWRNATTVSFIDILGSQSLSDVMIQNLKVTFHPSTSDLSSKIKILDLDCDFVVDGSLDVVFDMLVGLKALESLTFDSDNLQVSASLGHVRKRDGLARLTYLRFGLEHDQFSLALSHILSSFPLSNLQTLELSRGLDEESDRWTDAEQISELSVLPALKSLVTTWSIVSDILIEIMRRAPRLETLDLDYEGYALFAELLETLEDPKADRDGILAPSLSKINCIYCIAMNEEYARMLDKRKLWASEGRCQEINARSDPLVTRPSASQVT
ncbi:hypothetical protein SISNIDRAFT_450508 [Sistotremastrum niveocremeum HHB9708]|uniref:F-box domain-containing protein n=1 Tax=Sistotremastrum niveocremeum HHB9708 TaxID=1314777 RepID=A0A164YC12_9AGAM|nr:hypothetical protein SISNIDRAFT_450508 [Sistotremastrum niveocremeum HHB9708]